MNKISKWITNYRIVILIIAFVLLIPSAIGYLNTRVNYDVLSYLPNTLETIKGQDIMVNDFGSGAFSMIVVEGMEMKDIAKLEKKIEKVKHVKSVLSYTDIKSGSIPTSMLPETAKKVFEKGDNTMMLALFEDTTSSDDTMEAIEEIRSIVSKNVYISGMSGIVTDIKNLALEEMPVYVVVAAGLSLLVLLFTMDSFLTPFIFLLNIGMAIVYNMGSNIVLGEISYITEALAAVLQLAVTMDYSIFLLECYEEHKREQPGDNNGAMAKAIADTFKSVTSSSITTIAGFLALCFMTFALGTNIGIVMSKGVVIGVLACITVLPAMILVADKWIEKTQHKSLVPSLDVLSRGIIKGRYVVIALFLILLGPALYGNANYEIYYNIDQSLPRDILSNQANDKLQNTFNVSNMHMLLLKTGLSSKEKDQMIKQIKEVKGVRKVLAIESVVGSNVPDFMIPERVTSMLRSEHYELMFISSDYASATKEVNNQLAKINKIVKKAQKDAMVIGEAPMMKDLEDVTNIDLVTVNYISIAAIFIIILITFKSISIPVILVSVIEFAIACNMAVPYYTHTSLAFVAGIVIGTIQLGATVDYAILMTNRYHKERSFGNKTKREAILIAHQASVKSILTSGLCFFAATFGVSVYSRVDMIGSICTLLARGAVISMFVVICILPAMLWIFDGVIKRTTWDMVKLNVAKRDKEQK